MIGFQALLSWKLNNDEHNRILVQKLTFTTKNTSFHDFKHESSQKTLMEL